MTLSPLQRRWLWIVGAALLALAVVAGGLALRGPQVDAVQLQQAPLVRTLQFSARVATLSRVDVGSTITGRVAQVLVAEGAQVRQGDVLLQLESDELAAALSQAVAAQQQAAARLAGLRSTGRSAASAMKCTRSVRARSVSPVAPAIRRRTSITRPSWPARTPARIARTACR